MCLQFVPVGMCDQSVSWWWQVDCFRHQRSCGHQGGGVILRVRMSWHGGRVQRERRQGGRVTMLGEVVHHKACCLCIWRLCQQLQWIRVWPWALMVRTSWGRGVTLWPLTGGRGTLQLALFKEALHAQCESRNDLKKKKNTKSERGT